jgi:hypothetical protein
MKAIDTLMSWIGVEKRSSDERRIKTSKRIGTKRKYTRRKKKK